MLISTFCFSNVNEKVDGDFAELLLSFRHTYQKPYDDLTDYSKIYTNDETEVTLRF